MRASLLEKYEGRDLGTPDKLIGVGITVDGDSITMDQQLYAERLIDLSARHDNKEELNPIIYPYTSIFVQLMFLAGMTRPDLANRVRTDSQTRRSVTGYLLLFNGSPIGWRSKLRGAVTFSSLEAEWTAMAYGMRHCIFLRGILGEIGVLQAGPDSHVL
ncbi:unnamed protein product [Choristocarpus tenellus]